MWVYSVKLKIMTGNTRGSSLVLNSLEQTNRAAYCLQLASLCDVWWAACHADVTGTHVGAAMVMGHMSSVSVLSQTSHMISLLSGEVQDHWIRLLMTRGVTSQTSHNPCKYCHSSQQSGNNERVHQQLNILASLNIDCFQAPKIWKLIEKENLSHDVTVLIKGSLE